MRPSPLPFPPSLPALLLAAAALSGCPSISRTDYDKAVWVATPLGLALTDAPTSGDACADDTVTVSGTVDPVFAGEPATVQLFEDGTLLDEASVEIDTAGAFTAELAVSWPVDGGSPTLEVRVAVTGHPTPDAVTFELEVAPAPEVFVDGDSDGVAGPEASRSCTPTGFTEGTDCDDDDATVYPDAPELCDGRDNDCSGPLQPDEEVDTDGDGAFVCEAPLPGQDCDDTDAGIHPGATELVGNTVDEDCDGELLCYVDGDGDGYGSDDITTFELTPVCTLLQGGDCDDGEIAVRPGAAEIPGDAVDEDCDGLLGCWPDADGDGDGDENASPVDVAVGGSCSDPGVSDHATDCDDGDAARSGDFTEMPGTGIDEDCDLESTCYVDDDGDGFGLGTLSGEGLACTGSGYAAFGEDCDDTDAAVYPGPVDDEIAGNETDENCDGIRLCFPDVDGDGYTAAGPVEVTDAAQPCTTEGYAPPQQEVDCDDDAGTVYPGAPEEPANSIDEDCDGYLTCFQDADGDGVGTTSTVEVSGTTCDTPTSASVSDDCDDDLDFVFPGAPERCDGIDNDCDGPVDLADEDGLRLYLGGPDADLATDDLQAVASAIATLTSPGPLDLNVCGPDPATTGALFDLQGATGGLAVRGLTPDAELAGTLVLPQAVVSMDALILKGGPGYNGAGGVLYVPAGGDASLEDVVVTCELQDSTVVDGGGIWNAGTVSLSAWSSISGCIVQGNGGGIYSEGGTIDLTDAAIDACQAGDAGGGIFASGTSLSISGAALSDNRAAFGAGLYASSVVGDADTLTFTGNIATENGGGALFDAGSDLTGSGTWSFDGNTAKVGAALDLSGTITAEVVNAINNTCNNRGGIVHVRGGTLSTTNLAFGGNSAPNLIIGTGVFGAMLLLEAQSEVTASVQLETTDNLSADRIGAFHDGAYDEFPGGMLYSSFSCTTFASGAPDCP